MVWIEIRGMWAITLSKPTTQKINKKVQGKQALSPQTLPPPSAYLSPETLFNPYHTSITNATKI